MMPRNFFPGQGSSSSSEEKINEAAMAAAVANAALQNALNERAASVSTPSSNSTLLGTLLANRELQELQELQLQQQQQQQALALQQRRLANLEADTALRRLTLDMLPQRTLAEQQALANATTFPLAGTTGAAAAAAAAAAVAATAPRPLHLGTGAAAGLSGLNPGLLSRTAAALGGRLPHSSLLGAMAGQAQIPAVASLPSRNPLEPQTNQEVPPKKKGRTNVFPQKLYQMLMDLEKEEDGTAIASFLPHGRAFAIHKLEEFKARTAKYFRMSQFSSFQRQLNLYEFQRVTEGPDKGAYYHEKFIRGQPLLCTQIKRNKIKGATQSSAATAVRPQVPPTFPPGASRLGSLFPPGVNLSAAARFSSLRDHLDRTSGPGGGGGGGGGA